MTIKEFKIQYALGALSYEIKCWAVMDPNTPKEILKLLSKDSIEVSINNYEDYRGTLIDTNGDVNEKVRFDVAKNPNTPKRILAQLINDKEDYIAEYLAKNPNTPSHILVQLPPGRIDRVKCAVAANPNTPKKYLTHLSVDENFAARAHIADNPNTPKEVLKILSKDETEYVRNFAIKRMEDGLG